MKKWMRIFGIGIICILAVNSLLRKMYRDSQTEAIYIATVRDVAMPGTDPNYRPGYTVFFVGINRKDPSPSFLQKFQGFPFSVRPLSQGQRDTTSFSSDAMVSQSGEKGLGLNLGKIMWASRTQAMVPTSDGSYMMELNGNQWRLAYKTQVEIPLVF